MKEQQIKKMTIKDIISNNKSIIILLVIIFISLGVSSLTSGIPQKKENAIMEENNILYSEKYEAESRKEELEKRLKSEENKNINLNNKISLQEGTSFQVKSGTKWTGSYKLIHADYSYKLTLEINEHNAIFNFVNQDEKGSFYMGKHIVEPNTGYLELQATEWKDDPSGYHMVNLSGVASGDKMNGLILDSNSNEKLGTFSLTKSN